MENTTDSKKVTSETLDKHLQYIRELIVEEATHLAKINITSEIEANTTTLPREQDIWHAALKFAPGVPFPQELKKSHLITFGGWTNTGVIAVLTFVFGLLGLVGVGLIGFGRPVDPEVTKSLGPFLDIAKIFAGALVGAAGATAVAARRPGG